MMSDDVNKSSDRSDGHNESKKAIAKLNPFIESLNLAWFWHKGFTGASRPSWAAKARTR
ncbi:unannotated protein [freshwater metagenome]|uniref:Unannotated protein n=1 Tax=freshwater metagenome TaxID=449393 RepID=A0A6J6F719_9ZZZZ